MPGQYCTKIINNLTGFRQYDGKLLQFGYNLSRYSYKNSKTVDNPADLEYIIIVVVCNFSPDSY